MRGNAVPELDVAGFATAQEKWTQAEPPDYLIETKVSGLQPATYRVQVREHRVISAKRNDYPLKDERTLGTWSVPGMFGTIQRDVDANQTASDSSPPLHLRVQYEPQYGYPMRYVRLMWGTKVTTSWEVTRFEIGPTNESAE